MSNDECRNKPENVKRPARFKLLAGWRVAIGDSAGYVEPFTGEGMAWALTSGAAVAPFVVRSVNEPSPALAAEWQATHARLIRSRQTVCRVVSRVLRSPLLCRLAVQGLAVAPALSQPIVIALNRPAMRAAS